MDDLDLVEVYSLKNPAIAEIIKNALEAEGIRCELGNETQAGMTGILDIRVFVRAVDAERARELIASHSPDEMEDIELGEEDA